MLMFSGAVPLFLSLTVAGVLSAPTCVVPKSMLAGLMSAVGAVPAAMEDRPT